MIFEICPEIREYFLHISLMAEGKTIRTLNTIIPNYPSTWIEKKTVHSTR